MTELRLKNLLNLVDRGEPGESCTARKILDRLLDKLGMTEEELRSPTVSRYHFRFRDKHEKRLLSQVVGKALDSWALDLTRYPGKKKLSIECTAQAVDIQNMFAVYVAEWRQLQEDTLRAFIGKNYIYPNADVPEGSTCEVDEDQWRRINKISDRLDVTPIHKAIGEG